ncbi:MAG: Hpt domain-containing protein [Proteobacteria bacterium]|nr:Hpt domain-containing protein [Pseudomonadota bacterium]
MSGVEAEREEIVVSIEEDLEDIVPGYLENRTRDVASIERALEAGQAEDYDSVRVIGHSMKGTGGGYGFDELTNIGARIEVAGKAEDRAGVQKGLEELSEYLRRVKVVYE